MVATGELVDAPEGDETATSPPSGSPPARAWCDAVEKWAGIAIVVACSLYILIQLHPRLLVLNTTAAGGDTGSHPWFPAYLRDHLLPWRLTGWSPDFYAGFPAGQFYFPFPALVTLALDVVLPYNVAFKAVTALGPVALPVGAYVFGRGIRAPRPAPALFAVGVTGFLFFKDGGDAIMKFDHHIMGGTLTSTLAGEYSFTIALALALSFLGTFARAVEPSVRRAAGARVNLWLPALLLAGTAMSHLVVAVFAAYGALVLWLLRHPLRSFTRAAAVLVVACLLTAVWSLPLAATLGYTTDMRYEPISKPFDWMFLSEMWFLYPLALVAIGAGIAYRRRATLDLAALALAASLVFMGWELLREVFGKAPAWNLRLLPFWYLLLYLAAALGAAEIARWTGTLTAWLAYGPRRSGAPEDESTAVSGGVDHDGFEPEHLSDNDNDNDSDNDSGSGSGSGSDRRAVRVLALVAAALLFTTVALVRVHATRGYLPYWARYNYSGYEGGEVADFTAKAYPEYRAFLDTANALPPGRMFWEGNASIGAYGTPLALMMLPYFTDGRIASMEGVYYEAAGTTGYHFLAAATLTPQPANAVRGLPYRTFAEFDLGVRYLQTLGVRYYAATSPEAKAAADANPALRPVATVPDLDTIPPNGWTIYEVQDSPTVAPLRYEPVVARDLHPDDNWKCLGRPEPAPGTPGVDELSAWECLSVPWFDDPDALDRPLTDGGPEGWAHAPMASARREPKRRLPAVEVTNVRTTDDSVAFDVSRTGVPVVVKTSYYPNWEAHGADGPWRATPNYMVVVPTERHVRLSYATTGVEQVGRFATILGLLGIGGLVWWGRRAASSSNGRRSRLRFPSRSPQGR